MDQLYKYQTNVLKAVNNKFVRYLFDDINWNQQLIAIKGLRGVGKTTLLLQYLKFHLHGQNALYVSADHPYFYNTSILDLAEDFSNQGGTTLIIDEVHKYATWSREIKTIYDSFPDLRVIFTSSSALDILKGEADLSRRVAIYHLKGMSFRESINFSEGLNLPPVKLSDVLKNHIRLSAGISEEIQPLVHFKKYLKQGYFPFGSNLDDRDFQKRLVQVINTVLEVDLAFIQGFSAANVTKIKRLLGVLSEIVPYQPNISDLANTLGIGRDTVINYLNSLEQAGILNFIYSEKSGMSNLRKPGKIYMENPNLAFALKDQPNIGSIREAFFLNQLYNSGFEVSMPATGDFLISKKTLVEVGGKNKSFDQIKDQKNAFIVADDMESGIPGKIPLWLFGFLY